MKVLGVGKLDLLYPLDCEPFILKLDQVLVKDSANGVFSASIGEVRR